MSKSTAATSLILPTELGPISNVMRIDGLYSVTGSGRRVHRLNCVRRRGTIDANYASVTEHDGELWGTVRVNSPEFRQQTSLFTIEQVEQLPAYDACEGCRPPTAHRTKVGPDHGEEISFQQLAVSHLGLEFTVDGQVLGALRSYTVFMFGVALIFDDNFWRGEHNDMAVIRQVNAPKNVPWA